MSVGDFAVAGRTLAEVGGVASPERRNSKVVCVCLEIIRLTLGYIACHPNVHKIALLPNSAVEWYISGFRNLTFPEDGFQWLNTVAWVFFPPLSL